MDAPLARSRQVIADYYAVTIIASCACRDLLVAMIPGTPARRSRVTSSTTLSARSCQLIVHQRRGSSAGWKIGKPEARRWCARARSVSPSTQRDLVADNRPARRYDPPRLQLANIKQYLRMRDRFMLCSRSTIIFCSCS